MYDNYDKNKYYFNFKVDINYYKSKDIKTKWNNLFIEKKVIYIFEMWYYG